MMTLAAALFACVPEPVTLPEPVARLVPAGPSRVSLHIGPVAAGRDAPVVVRNVLVTETIYVAWSRTGFGFGGCDEAALLGTCIDLSNPLPLMGPFSPDLSGSLATSLVFDGVDANATLYAQAFVVSGASITPTAPIARPVFDAAQVYEGSSATPAQAAGYRALRGDLSIEGDATDAVTLPALVQVGGTVRVWENEALQTLSLPALTWVNGDVSLVDNPSLDTLEGLAALQGVGGTLSVNRMPLLEELRGLEALLDIGQGLYLFHATGLRSLDGLSGLRSIGLSAELWELYGLQRVALPKLQLIGGRLDLFDADLLTELWLPKLALLGGYELHHCDAMVDVGAFPSLEAVPGVITLQYNDALRSVAGFSQLQTVGALSIRFDDALPNLLGLSSLTTVEGPAELYRLKALTTLGLPSLHTITGDLRITDNVSLPACEVAELLDRVAVNGSLTCSGNAQGCPEVCQ